MKKLLLPILAFAALHSVAQKPIIDFADKYSQTITPAGLKEKLTILASADMQGRETATPGQKKAAAYIESVFQKLELEPGTTGGYQMSYPIYQDTLIDAMLTVRNKDYIINDSWNVNISSAANGTYDVKEVIFVSYGQMDSLRNDYKDLEVKDKWVLMMEGSPGTVTPQRKSAFVTKRKVEKAIELGAKGVFVMSEDFQKKIEGDTKGKMLLKKPPLSTAIPVIYVNSDLAHVILGMNPAQLLQSIKNIPTGPYSTRVTHFVNKRTLMLFSSNVLGVIRGSDKKDEYVIISAHYDHLGKKGKDIYYGADDDGSGSVAVLQLAEAFAKAKAEGHGPRRTMVFLTFSGEEKGLLGSEFYAEHATYPLAKTTADLNIDMVGRVDPKTTIDSLNYVFVIGDDKLSTDLRKITDSVNIQYAKLTLDRKYNNLNDINKYYYRSDHYNFAKNGVPVIFYFDGSNPDYHKPTDTVDKINFNLLTKRTKLVYFTAWEIANRNTMLKRDIPLP